MTKKALLRILIISLALAFASTICFAADEVQYVNINKASKTLLMTLPGINDSLAQKIIDNRSYKTKVELKKVIPADIYEKIKDRIITRDPT